MRRYEGMFLFDSAAARDWSAVEQEVHRLINRVSGELLVCVKFDERKLAYEVKRRKRGLYVLTYFEAPPERIRDLERDAELSDLILRHLVKRAEEVPEERINELKTWPAEKALQPQAGDGRRYEEAGPEGGERFPRGPRRREAEEAGEPRPARVESGGEPEAHEGSEVEV